MGVLFAFLLAFSMQGHAAGSESLNCSAIFNDPEYFQDKVYLLPLQREKLALQLETSHFAVMIPEMDVRALFPRVPQEHWKFLSWFRQRLDDIVAKIDKAKIPEQLEAAKKQLNELMLDYAHTSGSAAERVQIKQKFVNQEIKDILENGSQTYALQTLKRKLNIALLHFLIVNHPGEELFDILYTFTKIESQLKKYGACDDTLTALLTHISLEEHIATVNFGYAFKQTQAIITSSQSIPEQIAIIMFSLAEQLEFNANDSLKIYRMLQAQIQLTAK